MISNIQKALAECAGRSGDWVTKREIRISPRRMELLVKFLGIDPEIKATLNTLLGYPVHQDSLLPDRFGLIIAPLTTVQFYLPQSIGVIDFGDN